MPKQNNLDPKTWTETNIYNMKMQLKKLGLSIDWDEKYPRVIKTTTNINKNFLELFRKGLVYRKENYVNGIR